MFWGCGGSVSSASIPSLGGYGWAMERVDTSDTFVLVFFYFSRLRE